MNEDHPPEKGREENGFVDAVGFGDDDPAEQDTDSTELVPVLEIQPDHLVILPLLAKPVYPGMMVPISLPTPELESTATYVVENAQSLIGLAVLKGDDPDPATTEPEDFYHFGVLGRIVKSGSLPDGQKQILVSTGSRMRIERFVRMKPHRVARVSYPEEEPGREEMELKALTMAIVSDMKELVSKNPLYSEEMKLLFDRFSVDDPTRLADYAATLTSAPKQDLQDILETLNIGDRMEKSLVLLRKEMEVVQLQTSIRRQIEEKVSSQQREFFLREQLKAIKSELGLEKDQKSLEVEKFRQRMEKLKMTAEARKVAEEELDKLALIEPTSPEFNVSRTYLDWLTSLPWGIYSRERLDLRRARRILDQDHYGLEDVKKRILEFIAVRKVKKDARGSIICFVGPPGVGKTSMGHSIARTLNRKFYRFSLGGMRDEAEIKGHRRTYIGALPGKLIQALKSAGTANPVIMLDEIDKLGASYQGDPSSALLEVLDPEQNIDYRDHYLDVGFDLSRVLFITTANVLDTIPGPLLDRMEVLSLSGYITQEKVKIAERYLIPKQMEAHGISRKELVISKAGLLRIIIGYAREAGVRNLEKEIARICRRVVVRVAEGRSGRTSVNARNIEKYLGQPKFRDDPLTREMKPGVALGMAWTSLGGSTLYIEALAVRNEKGGFRQTGQLGDVMVESSSIAHTLASSLVGAYGAPPDYFDTHSVHLHVPAGATPKDGPSAGITMAVALMSLALGKPLKRKLSMTGELTLTGRILPVGGIKEKVIAARRAGVEEIILPARNERDFSELPDYLKKGVTFHLLSRFDEVMAVALDMKPGRRGRA